MASHRSMKTEKPRCARGSSQPKLSALNVEAGTAAARGLHVRVLELKAGPFQGLHVVHDRAIQIHHAGRVHEHLQAVELKGLVHHAGAVLELHRVLEAGATATDNAYTQA